MQHLLLSHHNYKIKKVQMAQVNTKQDVLRFSKQGEQLMQNCFSYAI